MRHVKFGMVFLLPLVHVAIRIRFRYASKYNNTVFIPQCGMDQIRGLPNITIFYAVTKVINHTC